MSDIPPRDFLAVPTNNGNVFLAKGFIFAPKEVEIVNGYLKNKAYIHSMPCEIMQKIDLYRCNADEIPMNEFVYGKPNEAYFFTDNHRRYLMDNQTICQTSGGYWKVTGTDNQILGTNDDIIAYKKVLVFYWGKFPNGQMSNYVVEEYRLNPEVSTTDDINIRNNIENLVLCKVQLQAPGIIAKESTVEDANISQSG
ncbi:hypothetical protein AQUCO_00700156v1 [Aquilegia coerulea]|uniref:NAC domain-containing protein n=1 Tax=Aquilegia coerulea TaxID=218851 RepID=A0A2G5EIQ4_AQUCA|nr:hypothetical protein AQUCO_00700156v1 [Aquilegia coerulea]